MKLFSKKLGTNGATPSKWNQRVEKLTKRIDSSPSEKRKANLAAARDRSFGKAAKAIAQSVGDIHDESVQAFKDGINKYKDQRRGLEDRTPSYYLARSAVLVAQSPVAAGKVAAEASLWTAAGVTGAAKTVVTNVPTVLGEAGHQVHAAGVTLGAVFGVYAAAAYTGRKYQQAKEGWSDAVAYSSAYMYSMAQAPKAAAKAGREATEQGRQARNTPPSMPADMIFSAGQPPRFNPYVTRQNSSANSKTSTTSGSSTQVSSLNVKDLFDVKLDTVDFGPAFSAKQFNFFDSKLGNVEQKPRVVYGQAF